MIIANRLKDGVVVFLAAGERWVPKIGDGLVIEDQAEQERLFAAAKTDEARCLVVDPNLIEVVLEATGPRPKAIREAIRAFGPTV
jgi:sulfite reductase (NADPH) hemoprotein beta-component